MSLLRGTDGQTYQTQGELARGGEGAIVTLQGRGDVVAKLYLPGQATAARKDKLRAMVANPPRDEMREHYGHAAIAWSLTLLTEGGRFVGFVMPRIDAARPLLNAYNPRARDALSFDWRGQHQVATNLAAAINALHVKGYVVGDVNPRNILVTAQGLVTLADTDSFQVRASGVVYRCPVGTPEYTPRELQGQHFDQIDRGPEHDRFGLAMLVFQLLMDGFHPFAGALKDPRDSLPGKLDEWCIQNGVFPWRDHPRLRRPPAARPLEDLAPALRDLFLRCFVSGHAAPHLRPSALEWHRALDAAQKRLIQCQAGTHWRYPGAGPCHACQRPAPPPRAAQPRPSPQPPSLPQPRPPPQPVPPQPTPTPQPAPAPVPRWTRGKVAAVFATLAAVLLVVIYHYGWWMPRPEALIDQARAALARGDTAAADQALEQATDHAPALAADFARDQAALYRELAQRAQARRDVDRAELAEAEAKQWDGREAKAKAAAQAKAGEMVTIPGGEFQMGCSPGDNECDNNEKPPHRVKIKSFRIGKYEVTQAQWQAVMGANPARFKGDDRPVETVSWNDIQDFLKRLNAGNPGKPYRLPTEAEWEYAARGGIQTRYWWGQDIGTGNANCASCGSRWDGKETAPVGSYRPNPFGLYDTAGNVWEWVADCWHDGYQGAPADGSEWRDNCSEARRVLRGGSWYLDPGYLRVSNRYGSDPAYRYDDFGLRLAQDL